MSKMFAATLVTLVILPGSAIAQLRSVEQSIYGMD